MTFSSRDQQECYRRLNDGSSARLWRVTDDYVSYRCRFSIDTIEPFLLRDDFQLIGAHNERGVYPYSNG